MPDDFASPFGGVLDMPHAGTHLGRSLRPLGVDLRQGDDRLQDVVQLVRQPAGDGAHGGNLVRLAQLLLQLSAPANLLLELSHVVLQADAQLYRLAAPANREPCRNQRRRRHAGKDLVEVPVLVLPGPVENQFDQLDTGKEIDQDHTRHRADEQVPCRCAHDHDGTGSGSKVNDAMSRNGLARLGERVADSVTYMRYD